MTLRRIRVTLALGLFLLLCLTTAALAQDGTDPAPGGVDLGMLGALLGAIAVALLGLWAVGRDLVNRMAARPVDDGWDKAKATMDKLEPWAETLARIANPADPTVAPTPTNPTGRGTP